MLVSSNVAIQENRFKLCQRWYLTPIRLQKIFNLGGGQCWRCKGSPVGYLHMWWSCLVIQEFGQAILQIIYEITEIKLPLLAGVLLLLDFDFVGATVKRCILAYMLTAALLLVAKHWKTQEGLTISDWVLKLQSICTMSKLTAIMRFRNGQPNALKAFASEWKCFINSKYNPVSQDIKIQMLC